MNGMLLTPGKFYLPLKSISKTQATRLRHRREWKIRFARLEPKWG